MDSEEYNKIAKNISSEANLFFISFCNLNKEYLPILDDYSKKIIHLNVLQFYAGFLASGEDLNKWKKYISLAVAIELIMIWAYKTNRIVDEKQDVWVSKKKIKFSVLEHDLLLSCIFDLLDSFKIDTGVNFEKNPHSIFEMIKSMAKGFWVEKDFCNINYISLDKLKKSWEEKYLERNINFNLVYDYSAFIGYSIGKNDWSLFEKYKRDFSRYYRFSNIGQIINDYSDFNKDVDKNVKVYQDYFSDIKNGIITYPIYKLIDNETIINILKKPSLLENLEFKDKVINLISKHKIEREIIEIGEKSFESNKKFLIENIEGGDISLWINTFLVLKKNRFFISKRNNKDVILCDRKGSDIGIHKKIDAHKKGLLHKAFSIFVFNSNKELLVQKRSDSKYHSGGLWSNTCCSHNIQNEDIKKTVHSRLMEEMGFDCALNKKFSFIYNANVSNQLIENEYDSIFVGFYDGDYKLNNDEVSDAKWISLGKLKKEIYKNPKLFTPWLKIILERTNYFEDI